MKRAGDEKLSKVASTKLTIKDYELCQKIAKNLYFKGKIRMPSVSELTRFALMKIFDTERPRFVEGLPKLNVPKVIPRK
jgi:hypothetical protein